MSHDEYINKEVDNMEISIIIVNYNSGDFLYNCIKSILEHITNINYEIIVVDNNSTDNSLVICNDIDDAHLKIIKLKENIGFSKANNIGMKQSKGTVLHFLNPDTRIDSEMNKDYESILNDVKSNHEYIYNNRLLNRDGSYTDKILMPLPMSRIRQLLKISQMHDFYYIGATVILPKHLMEMLGGWNEAMFMYAEDTDLYYKAHKNRIQIRQMPAIIYHYGGASSEKAFTNITHEIIAQKSLRAFYKTNNIWIFKYCITILLFCIEMIVYKKTYHLPLYIKGIIKSF